MDSLENLFPFLDYCESPLWIFVCERERSSVWDKCRREWLLGHMVSVLFSFITNCFPEWPFPLHSHQQCTSDPISLHPCQYLVSSLFFLIFLSLFFNFSYSERCIEVPDCGFNLHFTDDQWSWTSFHIYLPSGHHLQCNLCSCFFARFLLGVFFFCWDLRFFLVFLIQVLCQICGVQLFSPNL